MILITVATEKELNPLKHALSAIDNVDALAVGMGPVAAATATTRYLSRHGADIEEVWNIGVAGAYNNSGINLLDICLAKQEVLGDFGICLRDEIADFEPSLNTGGNIFYLSNELNLRCRDILANHGFKVKTANFVTVNCCTGTLKRGELLRQKYAAGCENMEGAAVAMVCRDFKVPCFELRCVSNMVEDRDKSKWRLTEALEKLGRVVSVLLENHKRK